MKPTDCLLVALYALGFLVLAATFAEAYGWVVTWLVVATVVALVRRHEATKESK